MSILKIVMLGVILVSTPALGMVYMWRDSAGIAHYTNREDTIPVRYKTTAKALYPEATDAEQKSAGNAVSTATPVAQSLPVSNQQAKLPERPNEQPVVTSPQMQSGSPRTKSKRDKKPRVRSDDEE